MLIRRNVKRNILEIIYVSQMNDFCVQKFENVVRKRKKNDGTFLFEKGNLDNLVVKRPGYAGFSRAIKQLRRAEYLIFTSGLKERRVLRNKGNSSKRGLRITNNKSKAVLAGFGSIGEDDVVREKLGGSIQKVLSLLYANNSRFELKIDGFKIKALILAYCLAQEALDYQINAA